MAARSPISVSARGAHSSCSTASSAITGCGGTSSRSRTSGRSWPDAPGCGESTPPPSTFPSPTTPTPSRRSLPRWTGPSHLVGNSFGAALALELAARHPAIVASLVVNGGTAGWSGSFLPEVVAERLSKSLEALDLPAEEIVSLWVPQFVTSSAARSVVSELGPNHVGRPSRRDARDDACVCRGRPAPEACRYHRPDLAHLARRTSARRCPSPRISAPRSPSRG